MAGADKKQRQQDCDVQQNYYKSLPSDQCKYCLVLASIFYKPIIISITLINPHTIFSMGKCYEGLCISTESLIVVL